MISSVQSFSCVQLFVTHGLQYTRPPCLSPNPRVYSDLCPLSRWCHPTVSSAVVPFSSCLPSFPASGSFQRSQYLTSGVQSIGVSASASVPSVNIQGWFLLKLTGLISLQSKVKVKVKVKSLGRVRLFATLWTGAHQAPPSMGFSRQEYWSGFLFPCSPRDSQESFPTPQLKSIHSLVLSFLYGPALTSIHDYWKNHSFD